MRKKIIMWLSFITAFGFILHSCRNEDFSINEKSEHKNPLSSKVIHYEDLKKHKAAFDELIKITKSSHDSQTSKLYVDEENGFTVDLDDCMFVEDPEGQKSYTFKITEIDPKNHNPDILENLVLVEKGENLFESYIFQYERDVQLNYFKSEEDLIQNLKQKVKIFGLGEKRDIVLNSKIALCVGVTATYVEQPGTACLSGQHTYEDGSACEYWGTTDMALPGYGGHFVYTFDAADCYGGGGGNPSSGSGTTGPYHGGGSGTGAINTPCEKIKAQTNNTTFKNNITSLEGKTGETSERGYRMDYKNQTPTNPEGTGSNNQYLQNAPNSAAIDYTYFLPSTYAMMHTHYDQLNDAILSPGDIIQFNEWLVKAKEWNDNPAHTIKIDLTKLTYTLVTNQGNYTLTFDGTDVVQLSGYDINKLNEDYIKEVIESNMTVANVSGAVNFNMENLEEDFLRFAKKYMNMPGMKLFKITSDGNTEIYLKPNNNRDTKPCN